MLSAIGVMFAADHARAARELVRVARPGGRIAIASWTPEGFVGGMLAAVGRHVSPPPGAQPATRWGVEAVVAELLGDDVTDVASITHTVRQRFARAEDYADLFLTYYGPTYSAANRLDDEGRAALRADLIALAHSFDRAPGDGVVLRLGVPHRHGDPPLTPLRDLHITAHHHERRAPALGGRVARDPGGTRRRRTGQVRRRRAVPDDDADLAVLQTWREAVPAGGPGAPG